VPGLRLGEAHLAGTKRGMSESMTAGEGEEGGEVELDLDLDMDVDGGTGGRIPSSTATGARTHLPA